MKTDFELVGDFHQKFELPTIDDGPPHDIPRKLIEFRLNFLLEELLELASGYGYALTIEWASGAQPKFMFFRRKYAETKLPEVADALIDLVYVALGTAQLHALPWSALFAEVQRANMTKCRAAQAQDSKRNSTFDVVKPHGWKPPEIAKILKKSGWRP
jgi:predicted HAD superfamily Cof-like phosphohydrolase